MRFVFSLLFAIAIVLALFEVMYRLVNHDRVQEVKPVAPVAVDISQVRTPAPLKQQQQREEKQEPQLPAMAPPVAAMPSAVTSDISIDMPVSEPKWENREIGFEQKYWGQPAGALGEALAGVAGSGDAGKAASGTAVDDYIGQMNAGKKETVPVSTTRPNIPKLAYENRINGWVLLAFTVTASGDVKNIRVMDAYPRGVFEANAIAALRGWKYEIFKGPDVQLAQRIDFEWQMYPYNMDRQ
jgi:TonB family protein